MESSTFIQLTAEQFSNLLQKSAQLGAHRALQLAGLPVREHYTRTEMQRRHGRREINDLIANHKLTPHQLPSIDGRSKRTVYSETEYLSQII